MREGEGGVAPSRAAVASVAFSLVAGGGFLHGAGVVRTGFCSRCPRLSGFPGLHLVLQKKNKNKKKEKHYYMQMLPEELMIPENYPGQYLGGGRCLASSEQHTYR